MRKFLPVVAASVFFCAAPAAADAVNLASDCIETPANAEGFALARGIVDTILPPDQQDQMMHQLLIAFNGQMHAALLDKTDVSDPKLQAIFDKFTASVPDRVMPMVSKHLPAIKQSMACAYTHKFAIEELRSISQFALSPAGRHYFGASMSMMSDPAIATENGLYLSDIKSLMEVMKGELMKELSVYHDSKPKSAGSRKKSGR